MSRCLEAGEPSHDKEALQEERDQPSEILEYGVNINWNNRQCLVLYIENGFSSELELGQKHETYFHCKEDQG